MRKSFLLTIGPLLFCWLILFPGCTTKNPETGTLTIQVINYATNAPVPNELVYIATGYLNLKNHIWMNSLYTDANGKVFFHDLLPIFVFYDTEHWENYGAVQVYAGIDQTAILYVNTPLTLKKQL